MQRRVGFPCYLNLNFHNPGTFLQWFRILKLQNWLIVNHDQTCLAWLSPLEFTSSLYTIPLRLQIYNVNVPSNFQRSSACMWGFQLWIPVKQAFHNNSEFSNCKMIRPESLNVTQLCSIFPLEMHNINSDNSKIILNISNFTIKLWDHIDQFRSKMHLVHQFCWKTTCKLSKFRKGSLSYVNVRLKQRLYFWTKIQWWTQSSY